MKTLNRKEVEELLRQCKQRMAYKFKGHSFVPLKDVGKRYCKYCGLVALRNRLTQWAVTKGCYFEYHPQHKAAIKRLSGGYRK